MLTGKQAATTVQPHVLPRHKLALVAERILMMDFTSTQAQAREVASPASHEGGGGVDGGHCDQAPERFTSAHHRWGRQYVPPNSGDPLHRRHTASGVHLLVLV
jgi:hypothetical protein